MVGHQSSASLARLSPPFGVAVAVRVVAALLDCRMHRIAWNARFWEAGGHPFLPRG